MMIPGAPPLVLASASPTRRMLLQAAGLDFQVRPPPVDEAAIKARGGDPAAIALSLADAKAASVDGCLVIGADQVLVCDGQMFDKPADLAAARDQLLRLRGRTHDLPTAVTCWQHGRRVWSHLATPRLVMRTFSDTFLDTYLSMEGPAVLGSVGAYRLEAAGVHLFEWVGGDQSAILGLPILPLLGFLRESGVVMR